MATVTGENVSHVSKLMRVLAARQTRYANKLENRTGTLWEGRFKASLIDSERYLLACYRYVDLNPVRAAMVAAPEDYRWTSYRGHAGLTDDEKLDDHEVYRALGETVAARGKAIADLLPTASITRKSRSSARRCSETN